MMAPSVKEHHNLDETAIFSAIRSKPDATTGKRQNNFESLTAVITA